MSDDDEDESANGSESSEDESWQVTFPELDAQIRDAIAKYDGYVFPKLNWSSPQVSVLHNGCDCALSVRQDAAWMLPGSTCRCQSPADIYLLLKSSDFVNNDLDRAFEGCVDVDGQPVEAEEEGDFEAVTQSTLRLALSEGNEEPRERKRRKRDHHLELVLKKWYDMPRSQEWRCFVRLGRLVGKLTRSRCKMSAHNVTSGVTARHKLLRVPPRRIAAGGPA